MRLAAVTTAVLLAAAPLALADPAADGDALEACVADTWPGDVMAACGGLIANPCQEAPGGATAEGLTACLQREADGWDEVLKRLRPQLMQKATEADTRNGVAAKGLAGAAPSLMNAERAWLVFRDSECQFAFSAYGADPFRDAARAACMLDLTARRVVDIYARLHIEG